MVKALGALVGITIIATLALILVPNIPQAAADDTNCTGVINSGTFDNIVIQTGEACSIRSGAEITGNIMVEEDGTLGLVGATIDGNVEIGTNGRLVAFGSSIGGNLLTGEGSRVWLNGNNSIDGNIESTNCFSVGMYNPDAVDKINGNIETDGCDFVRIRNASVGGNVEVKNTISSTTLSDSVVVGSVEIKDNNGFVYRVARNSTGGNMEIKDNNSSISRLAIPAFVSGNSITGNLECSGNNPAPVAGVSSGPNTVSGIKEGQCAGL